VEPLPYANSEDLYMIWGIEKDLNHLMNTGPEIAELQRVGGVIEDAAGFQYENAILIGDSSEDAVRVPAMIVSPNLFGLLGVQPALGRSFRPDEVGPGAPPVVVLTDRLWKRLGADPEIVGTGIDLSGSRYTVIGVMPPGFQFSGSRSAPSAMADLFVPFSVHLGQMNPRNSTFARVRALRRRTYAARWTPSAVLSTNAS
jgi:hypothetical protein